MAKLPDNWVSGYDGQRWYFQYEPTGMVQYHFPQEGDEYAEFLLDVGTGPIKLTPEDSLAIEQESKRRSIPGFNDDNTKSGPKTSGSKRERENAGEEGYGMSATGYFDSSAYFPDAHNTVSPLVDDDPEDAVSSRRTSKAVRHMVSNVAAELPEDSRQVWSPVGFVAELATQDTVKCAEELAPVELDATSYTPTRIQTNVAQGPSELPTHRIPIENKSLVTKLTQPTQPTQPSVQPVNSYPLVHASFNYPPLKSDMNSANSVSHNTISMGEQSADTGQNKFQPWKPTQGAMQQSQQQSKAPEALPQASVLQNQDSELGILGRKNSQNAEPSILGDVPYNLAPPLEPRKSPPVETSSTADLETSSIPAVLQPAHRPGEESSSLGTANSQVIPGNHARHDIISISAASHTLSYTPSVLKPGGSKPNNGLQESEGNHTQGSILPHRHSEQVTQASSAPNGHPSVMRVNTLPGHPPSANPKMNGSPGFLFFHEIPSKADPSNHSTTVYQESSSKPAMTPQTSGSERIDSQSRINGDVQIPAVAPLNFVKRHSSKSSQVSSITPETSPAPGSQPSQHSTHTALGDNSKPSPTSMSEGVGAPTDMATGGRPQPSNQQFPSPAMTVQQSNIAPSLYGQVTSATVNVSKPMSVTATPMNMPPSNGGIATPQNRPNVQQTAHHPSPSIQGPSSQNHRPSMSLPSQTVISGKVSMPPGPLKPQGNASALFHPQTSAAIAPSRPPPQSSNITHAYPTQLGAQSNSTHHANAAVQQTQANIPTSHVHGPTQIPVTTSVQQALYHPPGQNNARPHSIAKPPTFEHPQSGIQKPQLQHPVMVGPSSQQSVQPPVTHQSVGPNTAHVSSQQPHQHSSPVTQSVSPIQSQVSSPAQSVASLHISQASTPASTFATMNNHTGPNVNSNQTSIAPTRPSSVPAHVFSQQVGNATSPVGFNPKPSTPAGILPTQLSQTPNPSPKPYPMLPGQVTPLPSQIGTAPFPPPVQQSIPNNHAKPTVNIPQTAVGQQPMQSALGGPIQHYVVPGQVNPTLTSPQGNAVYGQAPSQAQIRPPQQQTPLPHASATHTGGYPANQSQPQHMVSYQPPIVPSQSNNFHMVPPPSSGIQPAAGQQTFSPPPVTQAQQLPQSPTVASPITATQGKPFTSTQAAAALTDAGKGMKKWAKKVWKNPAIKQTAVGFGGAVMAESIGVDGAAGAQLANSIFANTTRPPLAHTQTAPPQAHGIQSAVPQHQSVQMGQQYQPGKPQPLPPQPNHHLVHPQPGHPQPGHPQPGHPQSGHQQHGHPQPAHFQPTHPQLIHQPVGAQMQNRPPIAQNPPLAAGVAINFNAQAQAQIGLNQQQQYPVRPAMVNIPPPPPPPPTMVNVGAPNTQAQAQINVDATNLATAAVIVGSAVGAAFHHDNSQPQHGHTQSDHMSHSESHGGGNHGYATEHHHEQAYGSSAPATYTDNSYAAADTTYNDNSTYSVNNTYIDNTEVVNNTVYIENSTAVIADTNYDNTSYADIATYSGTEVTTNVAVDVDINSAVYTDSSFTALSMDESIDVASNSEFAISSTDYSGDGYGDFEF